ncbi:MAG: cupredoxin domain-containing protein [Nitrososphaeraceae archaeon]
MGEHIFINEDDMKVMIFSVLAAAALLLSGLGIFGAYKSANAQVNILPGTDELNNATSGDSGVASNTPHSTGPRFIAADIAQTNSLKLDSDVKNLVILIPDKRLITQEFLPLDATIVEGTKIIWVNGDKESPHGILLEDSEMQPVFSNETIPYQNGTEYTFDTQGTFTFSDPLHADSSVPKGTINVISPANAPDNLSTNSTQATAGLFVVQAEDKDYFDIHLSTLGYHIEGSYMIPGPEGNDIQLYVYTQKSGKYSTLIDRTAIKLQFIDAQVEE